MSGRYPTLIAATLALSVAACANPQQRVAQRDVPETTESDCAFFRTLYDWRALDDRNMIVWGPSRQPYHVTLNFPSQELRFTDSLAFIDSNNDGRLCGFGMDAVVVPGAIPEKITIGGMRELNQDQLASLLDEHDETLGEVRENASDQDEGKRG